MCFDQQGEIFTLEAQFIPAPFFENRPEVFSDFTITVIICNVLLTEVIDSRQMSLQDYWCLRTQTPTFNPIIFPWLLLTRTKGESHVVSPLTLKQCPDWVWELQHIDISHSHPYFVPVVPVTPHPLSQIVLLFEEDIPKFTDSYGLSSTNQYRTPPWIRPAIAREFGFVASRLVCHPKFSPFLLSDSNQFQPLPFLVQGKFPYGLVGNGPWLESPSKENFTTCHSWIQQGVNQLPKSGGFSWLFRWPEKLVHQNHTYQVSEGKLPSWVNLIQDQNVAILVLNTPVAYYNFHATEPLPLPNFRTCLLLFGFKPTILWCEATPSNPDFSVMQKLVPTQYNWVPSSTLLERVSAIGTSFVTRSLEAESFLKTVEFCTKPSEFQKLYVSQRKHPTFEELADYHNQLAPDFLILRSVKKLYASPPAEVRSVGWKCKFLRTKVPAFRRRRSQLLQRQKQICCECHRSGHGKDECLFRVRNPKFLTPAQQALYNFLGSSWKSKVVIEPLGTNGKTPSLAQLQAFSRKLAERNEFFWKSFKKKTGFSPDDCGFKQWCFGQIQLLGIPFFANLKLHRAFLLQLVAGFYLPLRSKNGKILRPPRILIVNDYKSDPILWEHFQEVSQKSSAYIPVPMEFIDCAENCFLVDESTPTRPKKYRLISDTQIVNSVAPNFYTRLPQADLIVDQIPKDSVFVAHDFTKFYTQLVQDPRSAARHAIALRGADGKTRGFLPTGLVFGAKLAPFIAIAITSFLAGVLGQLGLLSFAYIDDILVQVSNHLDSKNPEDIKEIEAISDWTATFLGGSGLILSKSKIASPGTDFAYLQWIISTNSTVRAVPSSRKLSTFFSELASPLGNGTLSAKQALVIQGKANYLDPSNIFARRLVHTCAAQVQDVCRYFQGNQYHLLSNSEKNFQYPVEPHFGYLVLKWLHSTTFEVKPRGFASTAKDLHFYKNTAYFGHIQNAKVFLLISDASETAAGGFSLICNNGSLSAKSPQVVFPFPKFFSSASSLIRELWGIFQLLKRFLATILEQKFRNIRIVTDNFGALFILSLIEHHPDVFVQRLAEQIWDLVQENTLNVDFVWERRSTACMQAADLLSKFLLKISRFSLPTGIEKVAVSLLGTDFTVFCLGIGWSAQKAKALKRRSLVIFPLSHEAALQWFVRLSPLAHEQLWLVPHFPNKLPWSIFRTAGFTRVTGNSYKSMVPDIPTTTNYNLWLTPSF